MECTRNYILEYIILTCLNWYFYMLQERTGNNSFDHNALTLKYKLDNEFELVFVAAYQKILQLSYVDKFIDDVHLAFRDKYKDELQNSQYFQVRFVCFLFNFLFKVIFVFLVNC